MKNQDHLKQSLWGKIFQKLILIAAYVLFRPQVVWEDKSLKKSLKGQAAVFVANHTHHFDGAFAGAVLDRFKPYILVSEKWYNKKGMGRMIRWCRCIPIDLSGADAEWYMTAEKLMHGGGSMMIFPEGGIAREGKMLPFRSGAALLSASSGAPIVPMAIYGEYHKIFGKRQKIRIGRAIESSCPEDMRHSKYARLLISEAEAEVKRLYGIMEAQHGRLPVYSEECYSENAEAVTVN